MAVIEGDVPCQLMPREVPSGPKDVHAVRDAQPSGSFSTLAKNPLAARLEIEDAAYHRGSTLTLPVLPSEKEPESVTFEYEDKEWTKLYSEQSSELWNLYLDRKVEKGKDELDPPYDRLTLAQVAVIYRVLEKNPSLSVLVTGHADGDEDKPADLARLRALNFSALLVGDRDQFVSSCQAVDEDMEPVGRFLAAMFGWEWRSGDSAAALSTFRASYNEAQKDKRFGDFLRDPLKTEGPVGAEDFGGLYDCYQVIIAALVGKKSNSDLSGFRKSVKFVDDDHKAVGFAGTVARESAVVWRSQAQRRVEVLLFPEELVDTVKKRGAEGVYEPGLCDFLQVDPRWLQAEVRSKVKTELTLTESEGKDGYQVELKLPVKPEGMDYFDLLQEQPAPWPGEKPPRPE